MKETPPPLEDAAAQALAARCLAKDEAERATAQECAADAWSAARRSVRGRDTNEY